MDVIRKSGVCPTVSTHKSRYIAILQHASSAITAKSAAADKKDGYGIMVVEK